MAKKNDQALNANQDQCSATKLRIHIQGKPESVVAGSENTLVFFRTSKKDDDTNNNNIPSDVTSDIVILSENNEVKCKYKTSPGEPTFITIGNNCNIVEIDINHELEQKLRETGEFQVIKGDKLVSVKWQNNDNWSNDDETYSEWKIRFIKDGKKLDTKQLEKEIFENIVDENNNDLRNLVTELIAIHHARLKHIEMGCIQLVLSTQSSDDARRLERQKHELEALLHRTIIPRSIKIDLEFQPKGSPPEQGDLDKENPEAAEIKSYPTESHEKKLEDDIPSDSEIDKIDIKDEIVKPERAKRVLSQFVDLTAEPSTSRGHDQKELAMFEKRSMKRTVGAGPSKEINPFNFGVMAAREPARSRQLMRDYSLPIVGSPTKEDIKIPMTAPIGFEGEQTEAKLEIINEESSRMPEPQNFEVASKSSTGASSLAISTSIRAHSSQNLSSLHSAIRNNDNVKNVSILLETTEDINEKDNTGNTALHLAVQCSNTEVVRLLLERNADVNCENANLDHPLHLACVANKLDMVTLLLDSGASAHSKNIDGDTPLHLAMRFGSAETIDLLLQTSKYPYTKNKVGDTILHVAARYGILAGINERTRPGVSMDLQNNNLQTPLLVAVKNNKLEVARALIEYGADVNCVDHRGDSPLHIATSRYMDDIANLLLNQPNINVNINNNERYTPAFHARGEIRRRLIMAGSSTRKGWVCLMM